MATLVSLSLTGCCLSHEWTEATCTAPKTCSKCQEIEGEALGHNWEEATCTTPKTCNVCKATEGEALGHTLADATYQVPATCSICGATDGEALTPSFIEKGIKGQYIEAGKTYNYVTTCSLNKDYQTNATLTVTNYQTFASDETHEAKEGYEWKIADIEIVLSDDNAYAYGGTYSYYTTDYYDIEKYNATCVDNQDEFTPFTVNWNGQDYAECQEYDSGEWGEWIDHTITATRRFEALLPVGYDGYTIVYIDSGNRLNGSDDALIYEEGITDENTLILRLK